MFKVIGAVLSALNWWNANKATLSTEVVAIEAAAVVILNAAHLLLAALENNYPGLSKADSLVGKAVAFLDGLVHNAPPAVAHPAASLAVNTLYKLPQIAALGLVPAKAPPLKLAAKPKKGFVTPAGLVLLALVGLALSGCSTVLWSSPTLSHGPSVALTEIDPHNPHPVAIAAGAGYQASACSGFFTLNGAQETLLCVEGLALGSVVAPGGAPAGALQLGGGLGTLGGKLSVEALITPWTANGLGFLQGGAPGTAFALVGSFPFDFSTSPPVGVAPGVLGYRKANWSDVFTALFH